MFLLWSTGTLAGFWGLDPLFALLNGRRVAGGFVEAGFGLLSSRVFGFGQQVVCGSWWLVGGEWVVSWRLVAALVG